MENVKAQRNIIKLLNKYNTNNDNNDNDSNEVKLNLVKINDKVWLKSLALCLINIPLNIQYDILSFALSLNNDDNELLNKKFRLETYELISANSNNNNDDDDDDPWLNEDEIEFEQQFDEYDYSIDLDKFLLNPIEISCLEIAAKGNLKALFVLFNRYSNQLEPIKLKILDAIPLTISPYHYLNLLPTGDDHNSFEVSNWYINRVKKMDSIGRLLENALTLVQHGIALGVKHLDRLGEDITLLIKLINYNPQISLDDFQNMDDDSCIYSYLEKSKYENFSNNLKQGIIPYLYVLQSRRNSESDIINEQFAEDKLISIVLNSDPGFVLNVLESSRSDVSNTERVFKDDFQVVAITLIYMYTINVFESWETFESMFSCMPAWEAKNANCRIKDMIDLDNENNLDMVKKLMNLNNENLASLLDHLDVQIESAQILSRWSINTTLKQIELSNYDQQLTWAKMLTNKSVGVLGENIESGSEWEALLSDMLKLSQVNDGRALGLIDRHLIVKLFFMSLLSSSSM